MRKLNAHEDSGKLPAEIGIYMRSVMGIEVYILEVDPSKYIFLHNVLEKINVAVFRKNIWWNAVT